MPTTASTAVDRTVVEEVETLVRRWLDAAATKPQQPAARLLARVLRDPEGLAFAVGFIDRVVRPEDRTIAARALRELAPRTPRFLPWPLRAGLRLAALASSVTPGLVVPVAVRVLRRMVRHLVVDASEARLGAAIARIRARGVRLNVNLLGEAVLGRREADRRLHGIADLLARPDVDYVSIKVSSPVPPHQPFAFEAEVEHVAERLLPLYRLAAASPTPKFINLDMEEYKDLDLTIEVFERLLARDELLGLEAGIVLQAYLPDALGAMIRLQEWAAARRARGGAPIKVRLVKGANLPMERVESSLRGWPLATVASKQEADTNYKRVLGWALTPERAANVRLGVAGHNLFDIAYAWTLAGRRGVRDRIEFEMLLGMAEGQAEAVRETLRSAQGGAAGGLLLYVPVVHPREFDVAIAYLVRRLEEGASPDNFMSAVFELHDDPALYERERARFVASLEALEASGDEVPLPNRRQDRRRSPAEECGIPPVEECAVPPVEECGVPPVEEAAPGGRLETADDLGGTVSPSPAIPRFANVPDTDPSLPGNREWAAAITARIADSRLGEDLVAQHTVALPDVLDRAIAAGVAAGEEWGRRPAAERGVVLRRAALVLERRRAELLEVAAAETGKTLDQGDPEVSEAIDFANYYAELAERLEEVDGATPLPVRLTVVAPPWNFPIAIPTGSVLAALAAGSAVVVKPAPQARRTGSVLVAALWEAGFPEDLLQLVHVEEGELGRRLIGDPRVDRIVLTGAYDTAALFRTFRPELQLLAETSGKNAIVVTPQADLDLAARDLVASAFLHAGQKCSAASLGILVGSVARSPRFLGQLVDAATSLRAGYPSDPAAQLGPLIEPAGGKLRRALTMLGDGERWLVEPRALDDTGRLWSPGVKAGVGPGSETHRTEFFGPVLGLIEARDLDEAIRIQNAVDYGLTAGLHSLDRGEVASWIDRVEAGNVYVNRTTVGAIVRRQPFGGWKRSAVGATTKAGGPNYLVGLADWASAPARRTAPLAPRIRSLVEAARRLDLPAAERVRLERALGADAAAWADEFGVVRDVSGLLAERNWLRYLPVAVTIRYEGGPIADLLRVVGAAALAGAEVAVSTPVPLAEPVAAIVGNAGARLAVQSPEGWAEVLRGPSSPSRVRLLGGSRRAFAAASNGRADVALYAQPVVEAGRVELLPFLREQAVAVTAHRFGSPTDLVDDLL